MAGSTEVEVVEFPDNDYPDYESAAEWAGLTVGIPEATSVEQEMDFP